MDLTKLKKDSDRVHPGTDCSASEAEQVETSSKKGHSKLVSRILSPAVQLWLRSQLQKVEDLQVKIEGSDRQILKGSIPKVSLVARAAIYQGLHLTSVKVAALNIYINLGQVLRGKSLRILAPFPISCELQVAEADLNASFESPILANAAIDFLTPLLPLEQSAANIQLPINLDRPQIVIDSDRRLTFFATILDANSASIPLVMRVAIKLASDRELLFQLLEIQLSSQQKSSPTKTIKIDLGSEVEIAELTLTPGKLFLKGRLTVQP